MVAGSDSTLSAKARRVLLKLDSGSIIGSAGKLKVDGAPASAVIVSAEHTFGLGRLSEKDVQRLENILLQMHAKVPHAGPLRTASAAIESLKRKASDVFQVGPLEPCQPVDAAPPAFSGDFSLVTDLRSSLRVSYKHVQARRSLSSLLRRNIHRGSSRMADRLAVARRAKAAIVCVFLTLLLLSRNPV